MARYIDADALLENVKRQYGEELGWQGTVNMSDVGMMIEDAPGADVVPKSEVERLETILNSYALQYGTVMDKHIVIEKARAEVAREIFEELIDHAIFIEYADGGKYLKHTAEFVAKLKKKYTED